MTVREFYLALCAIIPRELGCEWDKDGLNVCPDPDREVGRVLIALDATDEVVDRAVSQGYDLIFTHHPMLWNGLKAVLADDADGAKVIKLCKSGVSAISFHTRIDAAEGGVNDILASLVGLEQIEVVGDERIMRVGTLLRRRVLQSLPHASRLRWMRPPCFARMLAEPCTAWLSLEAAAAERSRLPRLQGRTPS